MASRNTVLLVTLAVLSMNTSTSIWGQSGGSPSVTGQTQEIPSKENENQSSAQPNELSSTDPAQPVKSSRLNVARKSQRSPVSRPYRNYLPTYRSSRAYYPYSAHQNFFGGGLQGGYNLGSRWINPNVGNHGSFNSGYNLGPIRVNPNFGNSW